MRGIMEQQWFIKDWKTQRRNLTDKNRPKHRGQKYSRERRGVKKLVTLKDTSLQLNLVELAQNIEH